MTKKTGFASLSLILVGLLVAGAIAAQDRAAPNDPDAQRLILQKEMAKKLKCSQSLLTGLALEDFAIIADNAGSLKRVGEETLAKVTPDLAYVKYSTEFVSVADELARRAKEKDLNGATLSYIRLTINCIECHKHVRDDRVLGSKP